MKVKTLMGEIKCPEFTLERTKFWVGAMQDLLRLEELQGVMGAALREAYEVGRLEATIGKLNFYAPREVVEAKYEILPTRSECEQPVAVSQADGSAEYPVVDGSLSGSGEEVLRGL
jgi:hypothetical protein